MEDFTPDFNQDFDFEKINPSVNDEILVNFNDKTYKISRSDYNQAMSEGRKFAYIENSIVYFLSEQDFLEKKKEQEEIATNNAIYRKYQHQNNKQNMRNFYRSKR